MPSDIHTLTRSGNDDIKQVPDDAVRLHWMPQSTLSVDDIAILTADPLALQKAGIFQLRHNPLHSTFCNPHSYSDFA